MSITVQIQEDSVEIYGESLRPDMFSVIHLILNDMRTIRYDQRYGSYGTVPGPAEAGVDLQAVVGPDPDHRQCGPGAASVRGGLDRGEYPLDDAPTGHRCD